MMAITDGILDAAQWCPSPNYGPRPQSAEGEVSLVVVHNISLPPGQFGGGYIHDFFQNRLDSGADPYFEEIKTLKVSSHLLIERNGEITQFVNFNDRAWHAGASAYQGRENCNDYSVGIELEGSDNIPYTDSQYSALIEVCFALFDYYPQLRSERITGHEQIAPERKTDPGPAFDWQLLFAGLSAARKGGREL